MESSNQSTCILTAAYEEYYPRILSFITYRIAHKFEAEDLAQDVFVRLLDYKQMLRPETVRYFLFTIARNIVVDHLRRYYKKQEVDSYIYDHTAQETNYTESCVIARNIAELENNLLLTLPPQRRTVYTMSRFEDKTAEEISVELNLCKRTVENHLRMGRRTIRESIRQCV